MMRLLNRGLLFLTLSVVDILPLFVVASHESLPAGQLTFHAEIAKIPTKRLVPTSRYR
jgi:hypothetical protein